jgi:uncharacterized protein (TIGR03437 family)
MSLTRYSTLHFAALALILGAGAASAQQISGATPANLTFKVGGGSNVVSTSSAIADGNDDTYSLGTITYGTGATGWLNTPTSGDTFGLPDTLTIPLNTTTAATLAAGTYTATIPVTDASDNTSANITVTLVVTSPVTAPSSSASLTFVLGGTNTQPAATVTVTVSNTDSAYDNYTVVGTSCPAWLTWKGTNSTTPPFETKSSSADSLKFIIDDAVSNFPTAATSTTTCSVALKYNSGTIATVTFASLAIVSQPLTATASSATLAYVKGANSASPGSTTFTIKVPLGSSTVTFNLDAATLPAWVTSNTTTGSASTTGQLVTLTAVLPVIQGMATGNYTANVGFYATGFSDLLVPISLQISNGTATLTTIPVVPGGASNIQIPFASSAATPSPTVTVYSSDEPQPFTATCTAALSTTYTVTTGYLVPCSLNGAAGNLLASGIGNVVSGIAFTLGQPLTASLDPNLFTGLLGNTVTVTIAFSGTASGVTAPASVVWQYTIVPGVPTVTTTTSPTQVSATFPGGDAFTVLVTGTNFVTPAKIAPNSSVSPTLVWLGTPAVALTSGNAATVGSYVVLNPTQIMVTIIGSEILPTAHSLAIGVANQLTVATPPIAPQVSTTLAISTKPVIYAMTSTASYLEPAFGTPPSFAPYELVSIFGDNFGLTGGASASATFDSFGKVVSPLTLIPIGTGHTTATTLTVTFTSGTHSFTAPVLFANQNQINAIVPSSVVIGTSYGVTVTAAGGSSDGLFTVGTQVADPGIFTLASDGTGTGAIINVATAAGAADGSINGPTHVALASSYISIYLAGLGVPDSTGADITPTGVVAVPASCVAITNPGAANAASPGLLQVVTTKVGTTYTPPTPVWTTIDGAVMNYGLHDIVEDAAQPTWLNYPPCMASAMTASAITVTVGTTNLAATVTYAGFVGGSIAGLYQINATLPSSFGGLTGSQPITVTITPTSGTKTYTSQSGVLIYL